MKPSLLVFAVLLFTRAATAATTLANFPNSMVYAVQTDAAGNLYVAGFQGNFDKADPFVAKLSPTGQTLYSTTFAGSDFGIAWAIAVDAGGAVYVFGNTNSPDFPVTPGALQTTFQIQSQFQGFVAKLDPNGKIVYSTFIGGATDVTPGLTSAPGLDSILVDSAGDAIITGEAGTNSMTGTFPPAPAPVVSSSESFVLKLDQTGSKILAAISGVGGMIATDSQGNIYVTGLQYSEGNNPVPVTPGAFQSEPTASACGLLGSFATCGFQYVAKLNPGLNQVVYTTYVTGEYGATPAAIFVDAQGDVFVAGTTVSPDYPTTPNAYEPHYIASAVPKVSCFFIINCINSPPAIGYLSEVNPTGTGLVYSSFFGGTQTDTIDFFALTPNAIYIGGNASSADLPGFAGYPQQCLPQPYLTRLSTDGMEIGASRTAPGKVLAYDAFAGTLITSSSQGLINGGVYSVDPKAPQTPIACILDSADLKPVTSIAPGELLSLFGEFSSGSPATPPSGQFPTSLDGVTVEINGIPSPLLYLAGEQINFQAPFEIAGAASASINLASPLRGISDSITLPIVASNPSAFLNQSTSSGPLFICVVESAASVNGLLPLALNPDGSLNTCLNPAPGGSIVTMFLDGLGVTSPAQVTGGVSPNPGPLLVSPVITANGGMTVASVSAVPGAISGVWQVNLGIPANETPGGNQVALSAGGVPVRDAGLVVWVK
jgi:uncharacterized protein (TIGR03437 family)